MCIHLKRISIHLIKGLPLSSRLSKKYMRNHTFRMSFSKLFSFSKPLQGFANEFTVKDPTAYDFLWTIKSFSKFVGDTEGKQRSGKFNSKGYSWKLVLYPNGNIVNGQISLYLELCIVSSHLLEAMFKVSYELFLFDQNTEGTLSKKGENLCQLYDEIGFRSMIDLKMFRDSSNGYLMNDSCMFGVKILQIVPMQTPTECLYPMEKINHEFSWKIENFSKLDTKISHEKKFTAGGNLWSISIRQKGYQKTDIEVKDDYLSLHMNYNGSIHDQSTTKISIEFSLSIIDQIKGKHMKRTSTAVLKRSEPGWGWDAFITLKEFNDQALGFVVNDSCIIVAQFFVLALVK
ncbi:hypothetical protein KSP40_PGU002866 [Platanthera guangdongensis]|uniref:MATH domain-containing protein n=1 Tax=Platanthera guangdongensis TaxID=2320717 RepID=A0ABR2M828_9ASPA